MRRTLLLLLFVTTLGVLPLHAQPAAPRTPEVTALAQKFVGLLVREDMSTAVQYFDATMKQTLPADRLKATWRSLIAQVGSFQKPLTTRMEHVQGYDIVVVTCRFAQATLDIRITFNAALRIAGLYFVPSKGTSEYTAPSYASPSRFQERAVRVGSGTWVLPGTLTVPRGGGPAPAIILVHGSGPHDRDETIGPNKPFRDLAWGLATRGIAVLRYDKRTQAYAAQIAPLMDRFTVKEETIDDALAAAALLRQTPGINPKKVFVLGHSLGGTVAPRIASADPGIAGLIILAGSTRPLENLILEQTEYLFSLNGGPSDDQRTQLDQLRRQVARVKDPHLAADVPASELPLGVPARYWLDLRGYDPVALAARLGRPMLILQGGRDYQVTAADFEGWRKGLTPRTAASFKLYPALNHLFMEGKGKSTPAEYERAGHVAGSVIEDIVSWIRRQ